MSRNPPLAVGQRNAKVRELQGSKGLVETLGGGKGGSKDQSH